ncbi:Alpha/Beta hydrolase protein [Aspergillus falconensis]
MHLADALEEISIKLRHARLDNGMADSLKQLVEYWCDETRIPVRSFEDIDLHFLHHRSSRKDAVSFPFIHGWHVSHIFSTNAHQLRSLSGGDWGSSIVRYKALNYPEAVQGIHINMFLALSPNHFKNKNITRYSERPGYQRIQETKPITLGYSFRDSPVALLAWYPWSPDELIQGSPSAAMQIYKEAAAVLSKSPDSMLGRYIKQPVGGSVFPKEPWLSPREQHSNGGHFAAWERPGALVDDVADFYGEHGPVVGSGSGTSRV